MQALKSNFNITKKDGTVILTPKGKKHQNTLIFLHGWGQSGSQWQDYFVSGGAVPQVNQSLLDITFFRTLE